MIAATSTSIPPPPRGIEASLSSFAAPSTGIRSKSKSSHVRVVARIRPMSDDENKYCTAAVHPILPEAPIPTSRTKSALAVKNDSQKPSSPAPPDRKGPFAFLTPKKKKLSSFSKTPNGGDDATPIIRNHQRPKTAPTPERPVKQEYGAASCLTAQDKFYEFDAVFGAEASQKEVYDRSVGDAVRRNIFRGYNTTIIAYGQTGSGKTFTMGGKHDAELASVVMDKNSTSSRSSKSLSSASSVTDAFPEAGPRTIFTVNEDDGIIPRAVHDLFKAKQRHESAGEVTIQLTYLEIYNDELRDLLVDDGDLGLKLCDHGHDGVVVKGLSSVTGKSPCHVKALMDAAAKRRTTGSTRMNLRSSRSHAICTLSVTISPATQQGPGKYTPTAAEVISAKLTLVDLAGSERLKQTGVFGIQQQESININKDLFVLGKVIWTLAEKEKACSSSKVHVPYRDSKLTRLLRDSLGGNCCTVMVACVSPASRNLDESVNTLRYAQRARSITNSVKQNVVEVNMSPTECAAMRGENNLLKAKLQDLQKRVRHLEQKVKDSDSDSIVSSFTHEDLSLVGGSIPDILATAKADSQISLNVKTLTLTSLDLEISEKKKMIERLRTEAVALEGAICRQKKLSTCRNLEESGHQQQFGSRVAPGARIEMVTINETVEKDDLHHEALLMQSAQHANEIQSMEEKLNLATIRNETIHHEIKLLKLKIESLSEQEMDHEEKVGALVLQLEFEQRRLREHEESLSKTSTELRQVLDERDDCRLKIAIQAEELDNMQRELTAMKAQVEEVAGLRLALEQSKGEIDALKKAAEEKENLILSSSLPLPEDDENNRILSTRDQNTKGKNQNQTKPEFEAKPVPRSPKSIRSDPITTTENTFRCEFSVESGKDSAKSDHNAIRIQAAKMLFYANRAIERGRGSRSASSSLASSNGSDFKPDMKNIRTSANERIPSGRTVSAVAPNRPPRTIDRYFPPRTSTTSDSEAVISNIDQLKEMNGCSCKTNAFSGNPKHVEFYLPKLDTGCKCGKGRTQSASLTEQGDPMALVNIFRQWQVDFLLSVEITTAEELVTAYKKSGRALAKKMRQWRKENNMVSVKTKSCEIALHIWSRTCKAVIKSVLEQLAGGEKVKLPLLEIPLASDGRSAVSSLGCGSLISQAEF